MSFVPSQKEQLPKLPRPLFLLNSLFRRYVKSQVRINEILKALITTLVLQHQLQGYIFSYLYKLPRALSPSRMLVEFSLKLLYSTMCEKNFQIYGVHIPRKCIDSGNFTHTPPHSKLATNFLSTRSRQKEITGFPRVHSFAILFSLAAKRDGGIYDFLYQNSVRKMMMTLNIRFFIFCMTCNFFKCDASTHL